MGHLLDVEPDREAIARYGVSVRDVLDVVESAIGGMDVSTTFEGRERYRTNVRYPRELRQDLESLPRVLVAVRATPARRPPSALLPASAMPSVEPEAAGPMGGGQMRRCS